MAAVSPRTVDLPWPSKMQMGVAFVLVAGVFFCSSGLAGAAWGGEEAPFPYVWRDVAIVYLVCALPLTWVLSAYLRHRFSPLWSLPAAFVSLGVGIIPLLNANREDILGACLLLPFFGVVFRAVPALGLSLSATLITGLMGDGPRRQSCSHLRPKAGRKAGRKAGKPQVISPSIPPSGEGGYRIAHAHLAAVTGVGLALLLVLSMTYTTARCRQETARLGNLLDQSRFGEARTMAYRLLLLDPGARVRGHSLPEVMIELNQIVQDLESEVAVALPADAGGGERLQRAKQLAVLGRTQAALDVLTSIREPAAEVDNLRGTIYETREDWETALRWYQNARMGWEARPPSPEQKEGLVQATTGIAYCQRKSGHYAEAEATYQDLLKLSRNADSHFLLALFYEDTQQTEKAHAHARQAMVMAPKRYGQEGAKLINKLTVFHFGCFGVLQAENDPSRALVAPKFGAK
jgi:tetratricopeptide (TPR) repeat protein